MSKTLHPPRPPIFFHQGPVDANCSRGLSTEAVPTRMDNPKCSEV